MYVLPATGRNEPEPEFHVLREEVRLNGKSEEGKLRKRPGHLSPIDAALSVYVQMPKSRKGLDKSGKIEIMCNHVLPPPVAGSSHLIPVNVAQSDYEQVFQSNLYAIFYGVHGS